MTDFRALTIRQPWAGAIAHQAKRVENRTWKLPAKHEGARILIHAAASTYAAVGRLRVIEVTGREPDDLWEDVRGAFIAVATLSGCHWSEDGTCCAPWGFARAYHWTLTDVVALDQPIPEKGRLGIWTPDPDLITAVTEQIRES
ncbi:ASCH domain-containing protein [Streptomyces eurythermus]